MKNTKSPIKFGTDGWRAVIGDTFTFENVAKVAQAVSEWVKKDLKPIGGKKTVCVGYDTRFQSKKFAEIVSKVLAANGIKVFLSSDDCPTPSLSYGVTRKKCVAGVMITASHNPGAFNGIKIRTAQGGAAGNDVTSRIESYIDKTPVKNMCICDAQKEKKVVLVDLQADHAAFIRKYLDMSKINGAKFKVLCDAMHGSGRNLMKAVLKDSNIKLTMTRDDINPWFEGSKPEPIAEYLTATMARAKKEKFDITLVLDGDADRIAAITSDGEFISPQKILGLLALHLIRNKGKKGGVVKTTCGTTMIDNIAADLGIDLFETPVGFKYISDLMINRKIVTGGEEAGGMGVQGFVPERDGTLAGLLLVEMMVFYKKNIKQILADMEKKYGRYYYERADLALAGRKFDIEKAKAVKTLLGQKVTEVKDFDGVKLICDNEDWLMLRPSGTEPLVRAYSEAKTLKRAKDLLKIGEKLLSA
ncbi:MAG: phosphoglucomutase/phosphomannomutase family protein [Candidatus Omnitrophica bacterium]|nr:phosphoglucomutase/phosphomannomutase family protein [Candidatus Omnitrophota bacterium]